MKVELKSIDCADIESLQFFKPENLEYFSFFIEVLVGIKGVNSAEIFSLHWCSVKWFHDNFNSNKTLVGRHKIFQIFYDFESLEEKLNSFIGEKEFDDWDDFVSEFRLIGYWEFENYNDIE